MPPALFEFNPRSEPVKWSQLQKFRLIQCSQTTFFLLLLEHFQLFLLAPCNLERGLVGTVQKHVEFLP